MNNKPNIRHLTEKELFSVVKKTGEKDFRARQLLEWIWKKGAVSFDTMTDLPKNFRAILAGQFAFNEVTIKSFEKSKDRSTKYLFQLYDGQVAEGVFIPSTYRNTICISSQAGCPLLCSFCATGYRGFTRNLAFDEIFDQVRILNDKCMAKYGKKITNIVLMGMGEPLLNYREVVKAIKLLSSEASLGFSPQRFTLSTSGIADKIIQLTNDGLKVNLAVSLNAANNEKRTSIMPINITHPLEKLYEAMKYYQSKTNEIITLEYVLLKDFNDTFQDVKDIVKYTRGLKVKFNLIEYNPVKDSDFKKTSLLRLNFFKSLLEENNFIVNIRNSRGRDISAACGQLAGKQIKKEE